MKAAVHERYGSPDVLHVEDLEIPTPKDDEVLIKVRAAALNAADWRLLSADPFIIRFMGFGLFKPRHEVLGADIAGQVEAVGKHVEHLRPGDEVFGDLSDLGFGGFAEYVAAPEAALVLKPEELSFEQAAAVPLAAVTALQGLRDKGHVQPGQRVLVNGASGGVGSFAVQIGKAFGAHVTGVCSTKNLAMVSSIGADEVIDYTQHDFTRGKLRYDLILDNAASHSIAECARVLNDNGTYVMIGGSTARMFTAMVQAPLRSMFSKTRASFLSARTNNADLSSLAALLKARKVVPVIDRSYSLNQIADAVRYLKEGHPAGKVVVTM